MSLMTRLYCNVHNEAKHETCQRKGEQVKFSHVLREHIHIPFTRQESPERLAWQDFFRFAMNETFVVVVVCSITCAEAAMHKENRKSLCDHSHSHGG
jgi:hypothetical protein